MPRDKIQDYIEEADCILIGSGLPRKEGQGIGDDDTKELTERLLKKYPHKRWVIDGGSLQVVDPEILSRLNLPILTPHAREFELLKLKIKNEKLKIAIQKLKLEEQVKTFVSEYKCVVLLKGPVDIVCGFDKSVKQPTLTLRPSARQSQPMARRCRRVEGGNAGMTKGGTGDVLAGLVAALYCKNDAFLSATAASYINKKAGESLYKKVGYYFNASDLADEIPKVMKRLLP